MCCRWMISPRSGKLRSDCRSPGRGGQVLPEFHMRRRIELPEAAQVRALRSGVGNLQQRLTGATRAAGWRSTAARRACARSGRLRSSWESPRPRCARIHSAVVSTGAAVALRLIHLVREAVEHQVVGFDRDFLIEIDSVARAENRLRRQPPRHARRAARNCGNRDSPPPIRALVAGASAASSNPDSAGCCALPCTARRIHSAAPDSP